MLLNTEELLALVNGDVEPDRLADLLDRLEHCPESADALQVLISLRANREEALDALHQAAEEEVTGTGPIPYPASVQKPATTGWAAQALRLAATVAIVSVISVWATTSYFNETPPAQSVSTSGLATGTYTNSVPPPRPTNVELTSDSVNGALSDAFEALEAGEYDTASQLLDGLDNDESGRVPLYLGMSYYFLGEYEKALQEFNEVEGMEALPAAQHQAGWYKANALLALDRPVLALGALEGVKADVGYPFQQRAMETYSALRAAVGMTSPQQQPD